MQRRFQLGEHHGSLHGAFVDAGHRADPLADTVPIAALWPMYIEVMLAPNRGDGADVFEDSELEDMGRMGSASVKTFRGLVRLLGPVWLESCANTLFLRAGLVPTAKRVQIETILTNILNMMWNCGSNRWVRPLVFSKTRADPPILLFRWAHPRTPKKGSSKTRLYEILDNAQYKGQKLTYLYDYGDCWQHKIEVVGRAAATEKVRCTDGDGHHIAEDAGCFEGWKSVSAAYRSQRPNKEQKDKRNWFETRASNCDPAGLTGDGARSWDREGINAKLSVLALRPNRRG